MAAEADPPRRPGDDAPGVAVVEVEGDEDGLRLDRWFRRRYPHVTQGKLQKLLRTGQVRLDGRRTKAGARLEAGQKVRVPPLGPAPTRPRTSPRPNIDGAMADDLRGRVLHRDDAVIVLDKPPGLAVQGGTRTHRHLDAMLDALRFGGERPRLVHRLDKDTSGVLVLARTAAAAALAQSFRTRAAQKLYWALVVGVPDADEGSIDLALAKLPGPRGERVAADAEDGRSAVTGFRVVEQAGRRAAWLALEPETGRTHQLRAHCAALGTPIQGDGKYGGAAAFIDGVDRRLHLHARAIAVPHPRSGLLTAEAPLPPHMAETWRFFGFVIKGADTCAAGIDVAQTKSGAAGRRRSPGRKDRRS